jgi:arylsulfatase A-like enzyme
MEGCPRENDIMATRPNILLITSDQQHWIALGVQNPQVKTPNLDRLAAQGALFERAYCPNPTCTPTRASIITGLLPSQHGAWSLGTKLPEQVPTVGDLLTEAGYHTALVGKAHFQPLRETPQYRSVESYPTLQQLDFWKNWDQPFYGFRHVELTRNHADEAHVGQHYAIWMEQNGCDNWRDYFRPPTGTRTSKSRTWEIPEKYHYNAWIADRSNALIDCYAESEEPFLLWSSFFDPHPAYLIPEPWASMYDPKDIDVPAVTPGEHDKNPITFRMTQDKNADFSWYSKEEHGSACHGMHCHLHDRDEMAKNIAIYYGMVSCMDHYIGKILDNLEAKGLADNTMVVFTTDHGHFFGQHGLMAKGPYHYEDLVKVPFIARWPGKIAAGQRTDAITSLVDLTPTFLGAAGQKVPFTMSGIDQSQAWCGDAVASERDFAIVENRHNPTRVHLRTYVDARYKLTCYRGDDHGELFDLEQDPGEIDNKWDNPDYAALKSQLLLKALQRDMQSEPLHMPRISGA